MSHHRLVAIPAGSIGAQIRVERQRHGWTQGELARQAGWRFHSGTVVSKIERGHQGHNIGTLKSLARALGMVLVLRLEALS